MNTGFLGLRKREDLG